MKQLQTFFFIWKEALAEPRHVLLVQLYCWTVLNWVITNSNLILLNCIVIRKILIPMRCSQLWIQQLHNALWSVCNFTLSECRVSSYLLSSYIWPYDNHRRNLTFPQPRPSSRIWRNKWLLGRYLSSTEYLRSTVVVSLLSSKHTTYDPCHGNTQTT